jgi:hypothetical protein
VQQLATSSFPEPNEFNPYPSTLFLWNNIKMDFKEICFEKVNE